jgi:hypothetical protein
VSEWRKSSYSGGDSNDCVEASSGSGTVSVRDTKNRQGAMLEVPAEAWAAFTTSLR